MKYSTLQITYQRQITSGITSRGFINRLGQFLTKLPNLFRFHSIFAICLCFASVSVFADETRLKEAEIAYDAAGYQQAAELYLSLVDQPSYSSAAYYGLARVSLKITQLDDAEQYIEKAIKLSPSQPSFLFLAGQIAGEQALVASFFSKLGYARDAKRVFTESLLYDADYIPAIIGSIRFHQQAPALAGGDRSQIEPLIDRLRLINKVAAFDIEAPLLLDDGEVEQAIKTFEIALEDAQDAVQFRFDFAMLLSRYGEFQRSLNHLVLIKFPQSEVNSQLHAMWLYQRAKLAALSKDKVEIGLESIVQYQTLAKGAEGIPAAWADFREAQLRYLLVRNDQTKQALGNIKNSTDDKDLKRTIDEFLDSD